MFFEWDEKKAKTNYAKHQVGFDEAKTVFNDPLSITIHDKEHSLNEHRYVDIGISNKRRLLVVVYTERDSNIRIISSRRATKSEREAYEEGYF
jgi:uncharacterized protein